MAKSSIRNRVAKLEEQHRFLDWFVGARFFDFLTDNELHALSRNGRLPEPISNRVSRLDKQDRKTLLLLWQEDERTRRGRSSDELNYYCKYQRWPEQCGGLRYSMQNWHLVAEWISGGFSNVNQSVKGIPPLPR